MYQKRSFADKQKETAAARDNDRGCSDPIRQCALARGATYARSARMPRSKKSIKSRSKPKKDLLKRKRIRRRKALRKGTRNK
jgi:hypothetical protein